MSKSMVSLIAAISKDRGIGYKNNLLVYSQPDLEYFKDITSGHIVVMGRASYESMGKALPNRENIVLTKDDDFKLDDATVMYSIEEALEYARQSTEEEIFFIGGASIYAQSIKFADKLYLTLIDQTYPADTFFPEYENEFKMVSESEEQEYNNLKFKYTEWKRK